MAEYLPIYKPGQAVTLKASAAVIGGRVLEVSGAGTVAHAGAASTKTVGVAAFDGAQNDNVTIYTGGVQNCLCSAAITAGAQVDAAAAGKVVTGAVAPIGIALTTTTGADQLVRVQFNR